MKLPNCLVSDLRLDEGGDVWFMAASRCLYMEESEKVFPVALLAYNKAMPVSMSIRGVATIVAGEWLSEGRTAEVGRYLIRVKIASLEYQRRRMVAPIHETRRRGSLLLRIVTGLIGRTDHAQGKGRSEGLILTKSFLTLKI